MIKILQIQAINLPLVFDTSGVLPKQLEPAKPIINTITNEILNESEGE